MGRKRDDQLEAKVTLPTVPQMTDLPLIPLLRPFGGDQLIVALNAGHAKFGTTIGQYRRHGKLPRSPSLRREVVVKLLRSN